MTDWGGHLKLLVVEGFADREVSLQGHPHYEVDAGAEGNPDYTDQKPLFHN